MLLIGLCFLFGRVLDAVKWQPNMKSFTHSVKQGGCQQGQEISLFEFTEGPGIITEQWFTGKGCINQDTIIRYYVDGEEKPSIDMNLYMGHGIGLVDKRNLDIKKHINEVTKNNDSIVRITADSILKRMLCNDTYPDSHQGRCTVGNKEGDPGIPWGTKRMGHVANDGGLYNTFRIPFQESIFVSIISKTNGSYWYNIRGVQNYPLIIGELELPSSARLKLYKQEDELVMPFEYIVLAKVDERSGLLYQLTFNTESKTFQSLEACFRAIIDHDVNIQYLSSGTEDLFLSSNYFSGGVFHTELSGVSYKEDPGRMCAYKFFEEDPVLFNESFSLIWRCGEHVDNECFKLPQTGCQRKYGLKNCIGRHDRDAIHRFEEEMSYKTEPTLVNSYAWIYVW